MWCIMFQLLCEMGILLWPEHHISVALSATDGTFTLKRTFEQDMARVIPLIHVGIQRFIQKKVGWYGLTFKSLFMWSHITDHGTQSSDDHFCIIYTGECWMEIATVVLCKLKLILGVYCVSVRWLLALCLSYSFLLVVVWWLSYPWKCFFSFTTADSGNIFKFT